MSIYGNEELKAANARHRRLAAIEGTAESDDGLVHATTGRHGDLRTLRLDPRIYRQRDAPGLARLILETVWDAAHDADAQAFAELAPLLPPDATLENTDTVFDPLLRKPTHPS